MEHAVRTDAEPPRDRSRTPPHRRTHDADKAGRQGYKVLYGASQLSAGNWETKPDTNEAIAAAHALVAISTGRRFSECMSGAAAARQHSPAMQDNDEHITKRVPQPPHLAPRHAAKVHAPAAARRKPAADNLLRQSTGNRAAQGQTAPQQTVVQHVTPGQTEPRQLPSAAPNGQQHSAVADHPQTPVTADNTSFAAGCTGKQTQQAAVDLSIFKTANNIDDHQIAEWVERQSKKLRETDWVALVMDRCGSGNREATEDMLREQMMRHDVVKQQMRVAAMMQEAAKKYLAHAHDHNTSGTHP
eukprot:jgi/Chrzof1/3436/Cz12g25110.t1